jgi:hypothetical protein
MTGQAKLQMLFDAAMRDCSPIEKAPTRTVPPTPSVPHIASQTPEPAVKAFVAPSVEPARQTVEAVFDKEAAEELGALLDDQVRRKKRRNRRESLVAALLLIGLTGGGSAWFVNSPDRVHAFVSAIAEIRSVGDVKSIVAKYQAALDKVKVHGNRIDQATAAMGIKHSEKDEVDPNFDSEMKQMMGGEGKTVGDRSAKVQQAFGQMREKHGVGSEHVAASMEGEAAFDWNR